MRHQSENRAAHRGTVRLHPMPKRRSRREPVAARDRELGLLHHKREGGRRRRRTVELHALSRPWRVGLRRRG